MDTLSKYFWIFVIIIIFLIGYKVVPIYYNYFAIRSFCQEHADNFHKYDKTYTANRVEESLNRLNIPEKNRKYNITVTEDAVYIDIYYSDVADFYGQYSKKFAFEHRCEGVLASVYEQ